MKLELCQYCKQPIYIICELNHFHKHKKSISQVMANHRESIPKNDLKER